MMVSNIVCWMIIVTLLIKYGDTVCTLKEHRSGTLCSPTDLKVYQDIPETDNDAQIWGIKAGQTAAQWTAGGAALIGKISGPAGGMISAGISNLVTAVSGSAEDENKSLKVNKRFENTIENEFNALKGCIDEKIINAFVDNDRTEISAFIETFDELNDMTYTKEKDGINQIENFEALVRDIRLWLKSNFKTDSKTGKDFAAYLPIFESFILMYDQIISAYLMFLKECETNDNYIAFKNECWNYEDTLDLVAEDIETLENWTKAAFNAIKSIYAIKIGYPISWSAFDVNYVQVSHDKSNDVFTIQKNVKSISFGWFSTWIGSATVQEIDDFAIRNVNTKIDMWGSKDCNLGVKPCFTHEECTWRDTFYCREHTQYPTTACKNLLNNAAKSTLITYESDMKKWLIEFETKYIVPLRKLNDKISYWLSEMKVSSYWLDVVREISDRLNEMIEIS